MEKTEVLDEEEVVEETYIYLIDEYCRNNNIESMKDETQQTFNHCLSYIYKNLYKHSNKLKDSYNYSNYNIDYIYNIIYPVYINICNKYNKIVDNYSFSYLTNISITNINLWLKDSNNIKRQALAKGILGEKEHTLQDKLISSKSNNIGILATLNHCFGWDAGQQTNSDAGQQTTQAIRSRYQYQLPNNNN